MLTKNEMQRCTLDPISIGKRIKAARKEMRLTQEELAGHCDCTPTHICNIENGKIGISLELLFKISVCLGKTMDFFVMDHPCADPKLKINADIAPKLAQCDPQMLELVDCFLDKLIEYQNGMTHRYAQTFDPV